MVALKIVGSGWRWSWDWQEADGLNVKARQREEIKQDLQVLNRAIRWMILPLTETGKTGLEGGAGVFREGNRWHK